LKASGATVTTASTAPSGISVEQAPVQARAAQPVALPPDIPAYCLPVRGSAPAGNKLLYSAKVLGSAKINFSDPKANIDLSESKVYVTAVTDNAIPVAWEDSQEIDIPANDLEKSPQPNALFGELAAAASQSKNYSIWNRDFNNWLYGNQKIVLLASPSLHEVSQPGETEQAFRVRLQQAAREQRDELVGQLRDKYASKFAVLQERLRRAQQAVDKQAEQAKQAKLQTAISFGSTLLSAFTGRKVSSSTISRASSAFRGVSRSIDESKDVARAGDTVAAIQQQLTSLQADFDAETAALQAKIDPTSETFTTIVVKPNKSDILVQLVGLVWMPYWQDTQGTTTPAW
jgi:hypothetical protein